MVLTSTFDFKWPDAVVGFFKVNEPVGEATSQIFSVDCFVSTYYSEDVAVSSNNSTTVSASVAYSSDNSTSNSTTTAE